MTLEAQEFIRRFLLHVLPSRFQRIRHYGFLANRVRKEKLQLCRKLLHKNDGARTLTSEEVLIVETHLTQEESSDSEVCPACKKGRLLMVGELEPDHRFAEELFPPQPNDTS